MIDPFVIQAVFSFNNVIHSFIKMIPPQPNQRIVIPINGGPSSSFLCNEVQIKKTGEINSSMDLEASMSLIKTTFNHHSYIFFICLSRTVPTYINAM